MAKGSHIAAPFVLVSICSGFNETPRWITSFPLILGFFIRDKYQHHFQQRRRKLCFPQYTLFEWRLLTSRWRILSDVGQSFINSNRYKLVLIDARNVRREWINTRIYPFLLVIPYTSLETMSARSNLAKHQWLQRFDENSLQCSCTDVSIEYNPIVVTLSVHALHPACSSVFCSESLFVLYRWEHLRIKRSLVR